ncbi:cytochrome b/b6 domain-containing protein [Microbacterium sp.]|uniref:cytochrome b/b6 domain-containing protein n=1 Tax=Microbacterium sp. TaxID=51671 RepID=UPI0025F26047|nr:cytochrome b/b6 domain-containing protein [Microbacterium sp.]
MATSAAPESAARQIGTLLQGEAAALRRGLPRTPGGEPWPPGGGARAAHDVASAGSNPQVLISETDAAPALATAPPTSEASTHSVPSDTDATALRRGLPRTPGGEPWPPGGILARVGDPAAAPTANEGAISLPGRQEPQAPLQETGAEQADAPAAPARAAVAVSAAPDGPRPPLPFTQTVWPGRAASHRPAPPAEPKRYGPFTKAQWAGAIIVGGAGLLFAAGMAVVFVRWFLSLEFMQDFLVTYPGEYHLPEGAPVGIPAWLGWQHFFNVFLMVLIIRTGLTIRTEKRPAVFWTPKRNKKGKVSLTIWFHQSLDLLWIVNGFVFVALLFVTGQWMRIVPTSWEVFPNALSAALQYVSLDWPTENGWVNYNSLQQLAYFSTVFIAAPLAIVTGYRMSGLWPKKNAKLSAAYPIEWARKVHFPVMLYFVVFIFIHVALVLATGALRNLNHMYAAQGSVDGVAYADNWTGFWMFVASLAVIAAAWIAARPLVLAPIARLFGTVSGR